METEKTEKKEKEKKLPVESEEFKVFRESFESAKEIEGKVRVALDFMKSRATRTLPSISLADSKDSRNTLNSSDSTGSFFSFSFFSVFSVSMTPIGFPLR